MVQLTYYAPAETEPEAVWEPAADDVHTLRYGYNLADLDRLARIATSAAFSRVMDDTDRYDAAWHAIAELLYTADQAPTPWELKKAGMTAINQLGNDHAHTWGRPQNNRDATYEEMPGFLRYWELERRSAPSPEGIVVDRLALWQIWPTLSHNYRDVLLAMAVTRDNQAAAAAVGKSYGTFNTTLKDARARFRELWHEHETPSRMWGKGDRRHGEKLPGTKVLRNRRKQRARLGRKPAQPKPPSTECRNGHRRTPENTLSTGRCGECAAATSRRYRARKRGEGE